MQGTDPVSHMVVMVDQFDPFFATTHHEWRVELQRKQWNRLTAAVIAQQSDSVPAQE
jgi:diphthamide biosynthesis methyltransferase